jgi:hypothetical protein
MDELFEAGLRRDLAAFLDPMAGAYPRWADSPAAARVAAGVAAPRRSWLPSRWGRPRATWAFAAVAALLLLGGAALLAGALIPRLTLPVVPPPTTLPTPPPTPEPTPEPSLAATPSVTPVASAAASLTPGESSPRGLAATISGAVFDEMGVAWFATTNGVLRWAPGASTSRAYGEADGLPSSTVTRVATGPDGGVWATGAGWVARLAPGEERWTAWTDFAERRAADVGGIAVGHDGTAWAAVTSDDGTPRLARLDAVPAVDGTSAPAYPRPWSLLPAPAESSSTPWAWTLAIDGDGAVWAAMTGSSTGDVYSWDGASWTLRGSKADLGGDPSLPGDVSLAGVGPDGSIWVTLPAMCMSASGPCPDPGSGVARFDGTRWTRYGTEDGLLDTDVRLGIGADGSVWATYARLPGAVSRSDGTRWTTQAAAPAGSAAIAVAPDGRLWLAGNDDLFATDGTAALHLGMPMTATPAPQPITLEPTGVTGSADGPTGPISWREYGLPAGHFIIPVGSAHGPVAVEGNYLRWSTDGGVTWEGTPLSIGGWRVVADGDDLVAFGSGAVRLAWRNGRWVETTGYRFEPPLDFVQSMTFGPAGAVATSGGIVYFSRDGTTFRRASREPDAGGPTSDVPDEGTSGRCAPPGGASGSAAIGPVLATADGFVAYAAADPADWNETPVCEPLAWASPDGDVWTRASADLPFGGGAWVAGIAGRVGRYVAVGGHEGEGAAWVSDDGIAWRSLGLDLGFAGWSVAADDRGWVIASLDTSPSASGLWISRDGTAWEALPSAVPAPGGYIGPVIVPYPGGMTITNGGEVAVITLER